MRAGRLDEVICIEYESTVVDPVYGSETVSFVPKLTTRADVTYNNGTETLSNETVVNTHSVNFRIRLRDGVCETDEIVWRGDRYRITNIEVNRRLRHLIIETSKILN
jgi:SPP1 family predicted phage head-tail adaptor